MASPLVQVDDYIWVNPKQVSGVSGSFDGIHIFEVTIGMNNSNSYTLKFSNCEIESTHVHRDYSHMSLEWRQECILSVIEKLYPSPSTDLPQRSIHV